MTRSARARIPGTKEPAVSEPDITEIARSIVVEDRFMARGTADASGAPWVSPVWYAPLSSRAYVWVSRPATRHSRNLAERPRVAIAIYDSHRPGTWAAFRRRRRGARGGRRRARCLQPTIRGAGAPRLVARRGRPAGRFPSVPRHGRRAVRPRRPRRATSRAAGGGLTRRGSRSSGGPSRARRRHGECSNHSKSAGTVARAPPPVAYRPIMAPVK